MPTSYRSQPENFASIIFTTIKNDGVRMDRLLRTSHRSCFLRLHIKMLQIDTKCVHPASIRTPSCLNQHYIDANPTSGHRYEVKPRSSFSSVRNGGRVTINRLLHILNPFFSNQRERRHGHPRSNSCPDLAMTLSEWMINKGGMNLRFEFHRLDLVVID